MTAATRMDVDLEHAITETSLKRLGNQNVANEGYLSHPHGPKALGISRSQVDWLVEFIA